MIRLAAAAASLAAAGYAFSAAVNWRRYGRPARPSAEESDRLLDDFIPEYEIVERHRIAVAAPAATTLATARDQDLLAHPVIRAVFRMRELVMQGTAEQQERPRALLPQVLSLGWGILADVPGREVVVGAVTQPWKSDVVFHALPPGRFRAFGEPGFVKIAWSLRADPTGPQSSVFRTETRAVATDASARMKFRRYWSLVSPGVGLIRRMSLGPLKCEAERRARQDAGERFAAAAARSSGDVEYSKP
jgi:hypothetical protein